MPPPAAGFPDRGRVSGRDRVRGRGGWDGRCRVGRDRPGRPCAATSQRARSERECECDHAHDGEPADPHERATAGADSQSNGLSDIGGSGSCSHARDGTRITAPLDRFAYGRTSTPGMDIRPGSLASSQTCWSTNTGFPSGSTAMKLAGPVVLSSAVTWNSTPLARSSRWSCAPLCTCPGAARSRPSRVEGQDVALEHALEEPDRHVAVLEDEPALRGFPKKGVNPSFS